ncbi:MAG TPA: HEPN domain-containing protein [Solirubrobacterales bacterium]|nr:HEPN domain-containing protein [Solirubrobacterales bacterium]
MRRRRAEAERWLAQAASDLAFADLGAREGFPAQACFVCQQAGEKALKALHYLRGARVVLGHSLVELLDGLAGDHPELHALRETAQQLDQYYIPTRYPNGLPGGVPAEVFTPRQAAEAVASVRQIIVLVGAAIRASGT